MSNNLLQGKKGIIFGALDPSSIAWKVAESAKAEGAEFILTNAPVAVRMGQTKQLAEQLGEELIPADATSLEDLQALLDRAAEKYGKIDFILHSIGMSPNVRKGREYTDLNYDWFAKTADVSATSFHKVMQLAYKMDIINEWGSVLALTFIAAQRQFDRYGDMAEAKALLESFARSFGAKYGRHRNVRVNTISQSPTITTAGTGVKSFDKLFHFGQKISPLGNASAEACANYCVMMFSDYTRMVTMQNLFHDGGFSSMGITEEMLDIFMAAKEAEDAGK